MRASWLQRRWPALRSKGRMHFILVHGLLLWGGMMSVLLVALLLLAARHQVLNLPTILPLVPVFCLPAGAFWGLLSWHWNEYLYRTLGFDKGSPPT